MKKSTNTNANANATAEKTARAERVTLCIIRPNTGDITRGYSFALQTKKNMQLIGEIALADAMNHNKHESAKIEKICVKTLDFAEVLATGIKFCRDNKFVPCKALRLYGDGAVKLVADRDRVAKYWHDLTKVVTEKQAKLLEVATSKGYSSTDAYRKAVAAASAAAAKAVDAMKAYEPEYKAEMKEYRNRVRAAVAVVASFAELRGE